MKIDGVNQFSGIIYRLFFKPQPYKFLKAVRLGLNFYLMILSNTQSIRFFSEA